MIKQKTRIVCFLILGLLLSCKPESKIIEPMELLIEVPAHFPTPVFPVDNELTRSRVELGKKLFFDPILSLDNTISCSSCHKPELAFADDRAISPGVEGRLGFRNAPSLLNVVYRDYMLKDGGVPTLELQANVPILDHAEMDFNIVLAAERLSQNLTYVTLSNLAYNRNPDPFVITRALAAFQRTLMSGNSRYDQHLNGDANALTIPELRGEDLFFGTRANCSQCHSGVLLTNQAFENNGLYTQYADSGRARVTWSSSDVGKFSVPSLRNIALTAPYMHDGSFSSLEDVLDHYNSGGMNHPNKNALIQPLNLTPQEKQDIISFLNSLTGPI